MAVKHIKIKGFPQIKLSDGFGSELTECWLTPCQKYEIRKDYRLYNQEEEEIPFKFVPTRIEYDTEEFSVKHSLKRFDTIYQAVYYYRENMYS